MVDLHPIGNPETVRTITGDESAAGLSAPRKILVTGATGKQGGALIGALLRNPPPFNYKILAVTRNSASAAAQSWVAYPKVEVLQGDLNDCPVIFEAAGGQGAVWGVFSVQVPEMGKKDHMENRETKQGCALVDAAIQYGVKHFVYSSVDRGGKMSDTTKTDVGHFVTKYYIEEHLKTKAKEHNMTYTILRPVAFMENCSPNMFGKTFATMWADMGVKKLQLVSVTDIGVFAALALGRPQNEEFKNQCISLAGDELTQKEGDEVFWKNLHRPMPKSWWVMGWALQTFIGEVGTMFKWFREVGYGADIEQCRRLNSDMMDFERYIKERSGFQAW